MCQRRLLPAGAAAAELFATPALDPATERLTALLSRWTNYERLRPDRPRWSLDNMRALLARPGARLPAGRLVQVGGSKGKGTTALYLESLALAGRLRAGTYLSPHLESLLERVRLRGSQIDEPTLRAALDPILAFAEQTGRDITFFEVMTAAAVECFAAAAVDVGVLEVGLGGRLDATTAVPVDASILTSIELEHTELLGGTLAAIAGEKAWVVRAQRPAFTSLRGVALDVVRSHAAAVRAPLFVLDEHFGLDGVEDHGDALSGHVTDTSGLRRPFRLPGASMVELQAFALAYACLRWLLPDVDLPLTPAPRPELPGRCEVRRCADGGSIVFDGAHTPGSLACLASEVQRRFPRQRPVLLFGSARGKDWRLGLMPWLPLVDSVYVTELTGTVSEEPGAIANWLAERGVQAQTVPDAATGVGALLRHDGPRIVTGSFYLVGAARACLRESPDPR